jgi:hypothetical protein
MTGYDLAKLIAAAVAIYGLYSALQSFEKKQHPGNAVLLAAVGVSAYTAVQKMG